MKGCKGSLPLKFPIFFLAFGSQIFFIIATKESPLPKDKRRNSNCTYLVNIETSCTKGAETSNKVSLRFGDGKSNDILVRHLNGKQLRRVNPLESQVLDDVSSRKKKPFQACIVDKFKVSGTCVESPICYMYLKVAAATAGKDNDDDWKPDFVQIQVLEDSRTHFSSRYFHLRRYLPRRVWYGLDVCDSNITPFGIKFKRKILGKNNVHEISNKIVNIIFHANINM